MLACQGAKVQREVAAPEQSLLATVQRWSGSDTHAVQDAMLRSLLQHALLRLH